MRYVLTRALLATLAATVIAGCSAQGEFPSLAPRPIELGPIELGSSQSPPSPSVSPAPLSSPQLLTRADAAVKLAESGLTAFDIALSAARSAAASSDGKPGSERWITAQTALSQLERTRAPAANAMADLDDVRRTLLMGPASADGAAVEAAWAKVQDIYQTQAEASQTVSAQANRG